VTGCSHPAWVHIGTERYCASCGVDRDDLPETPPDAGAIDWENPIEHEDGGITFPHRRGEHGE
jgi:hypothetical protein